ncbi:hypothetical protein FRAHR75_1490006 [Frankia sp. Hr75.2]|nr:hypothetical protein FRAHR75_1490006 [Frankia sp. Hr75.2]
MPAASRTVRSYARTGRRTRTMSASATTDRGSSRSNSEKSRSPVGPCGVAFKSVCSASWYDVHAPDPHDPDGGTQPPLDIDESPCIDRKINLTSVPPGTTGR